MRPATETRIRELLSHLEILESRRPVPDETAIIAVARDAIVDELSRLFRADGLAVFRRGGSIAAVSMVG